MSTNIEIKARYPDYRLFKEKIRTLPVTFVGLDEQRDVFFNTAMGRLKLRSSSLSGPYLIPYIRPDQAGPKRSDYVLIPVENAELTEQLLSRILGVGKIVEKNRTLYLYKNVRIHFDRVNGLGSFIEFEAVAEDEKSIDEEKQKINFLLNHFSVAQDELVAQAYADLVK